MSKEKVLVVDDEEDILELMKHNFSREGYRVIGVLSGEEALTKVFVVSENGNRDWELLVESW